MSIRSNWSDLDPWLGSIIGSVRIHGLLEGQAW